MMCKGKLKNYFHCLGIINLLIHFDFEILNKVGRSFFH